jgi:uncharacterized membrane protein YtjA (UPF0391 family)
MTIQMIPGTQIPQEGQTIPRDVVEFKHPNYDAERKINDFHAAAFNGDGGFAPNLDPWKTADVPWDAVSLAAYFDDKPSFPDTYLEPSLREGKKFERRLHRAWYRNVIKPAIRKLAGFLMKIPPERAGLPPHTDKWLNSVSVGGLSMNRWLETEAIPWTLVYGRPSALLDRPGTDSLTRAQQDESGVQLTVGIIHQSSVLDWAHNPNRTYNWLKYLEVMDAPREPLDTEAGTLYRYRWITSEGWYYVDDIVTNGEDKDTKRPQDLEVKKSGLWKRGADGQPQGELLDGPPLASGRLGETGESYIKDAAPAARAMYNNTSRRDNLLIQTDFGMLAVQGEVNPDDGPQVVGPNEIYMYDLEAKNRPVWLSPDTGPFDTHLAVDQQLEDVINAMLGFTIGSAGTTGIAKSFDMVELTRLLVSLSSDMAEFELRILQVAAAMHNEKWPDNATSTWNTEFDAVDLDKLVESLLSLLRSNVLGSTADMLLMRRVTRAALPNTTSEEWEAIKAEQKQIAQGRTNADDETEPDGVDDDGDAFPDEGSEGDEPTAALERPEAKSR